MQTNWHPPPESISAFFIMFSLLFIFVVYDYGQVFGQNDEFELYEENIPGSEITISMTPVEGDTFEMGLYPLLPSGSVPLILAELPPKNFSKPLKMKTNRLKIVK